MKTIDFQKYVGVGYAVFRCPYPISKADLIDLKEALEIQMRLLERTAIIEKSDA